jgi:hypothetical protein
LDLKALSRRQSRALVAEILQKVEQIPDKLCDLWWVAPRAIPSLWKN